MQRLGDVPVARGATVGPLRRWRRPAMPRTTSFLFGRAASPATRCWARAACSSRPTSPPTWRGSSAAGADLACCARATGRRRRSGGEARRVPRPSARPRAAAGRRARRGLRTDDDLLDAAWTDAPPALRPFAAVTLGAPGEARSASATRRCAMAIAAASGVVRPCRRVEIGPHRVADAPDPPLRAVRLVATGSSSTEMLMMPPALATKSGAQRMPRWASTATASSASWLFAAPAITGTAAPARTRGQDAAERTRGEDVPSAVIAAAGSPDRAGSAASSRRPRSMSATTSPRRPQRASGRGAADVAEAADARPPAGERWSPKPLDRDAIAASTPSAVHGLGSPEPPSRSAGR